METSQTASPQLSTGSYSWTEKYLYYKWQVVRRHPDYINFCEKYAVCFNEDGVLIPLFPLVSREYETIMQRFNLDIIYHYKKSLDSEEFISYCVFNEPFAIKPLFRKERPDQFTPLWDESHIRLEVDIKKDIPDKQLTEELLERVEEAREIAGIKKCALKE